MLVSMEFLGSENYCCDRVYDVKKCIEIATGLNGDFYGDRFCGDLSLFFLDIFGLFSGSMEWHEARAKKMR